MGIYSGWSSAKFYERRRWNLENANRRATRRRGQDETAGMRGDPRKENDLRLLVNVVNVIKK